MPILETTISKVSARPVRRGLKWDIYGAPTGSGCTPVYETWDALTASLCDRARLLRRPVHLALKDSRYGLEIVAAALVERVQ